MQIPPFIRWREEADQLERRGQLSLAAFMRSVADEQAAYEAERELEELTLTEASRESGLSESQLSRLLSAGRIHQAGVKGSPRIRRRDLPRKPAKASVDGPDLVAAVLAKHGAKVP